MIKRLQCFPLLLIGLICFYGCKKNDSNSPNKKPEPIQYELKGLEILQGNNQLVYKGDPLDTITIKIKLNAPADDTTVRYYSKSSNINSGFYIHSQAKSGNDIILKAIWQPYYMDSFPSVKLYVSTKCTYNQLIEKSCPAMDSITISAKFRRQWQSVYYGNQGGYNVLYDLHFIDDVNGIVVGDGSGVIRTSDSGKTWTIGGPVRNDNSAYIISFSGKDTALVNLVNNYSYFTYDGGRTFFQPNSWTPPFIGHLSSSCYYLQSRNIIYTVGWRGGIAKTTDGGTTWDKSGSFNILNNLNDLMHIGTDTLFACGTIGFIARTIDAGKTWKQLSVQLNNNLNKIYFIDNSIGFVGGQYGALLRTTDGGEHWTNISTGLGFPIMDIRFFKNGHGLIVSSGGEIAESNNNGLSWTLLMKGNYGAGDLRKAVIKDEKNIFGLQQSSILTYNISE